MIARAECGGACVCACLRVCVSLLHATLTHLRLQGENAALQKDKRGAEELLVKFKSEMQVRLRVRLCVVCVCVCRVSCVSCV